MSLKNTKSFQHTLNKQNFGTHDRQNEKYGERLTLDLLLSYIDDNMGKIKTIDCIDLNDTKHDVEKSIKNLEFQHVKKISFLPDNLADVFDLENEKITYMHAGVLQFLKYIDKKHVSKTVDKFNVTLFSSILVCIKPNFLSQPIAIQTAFITNLIHRLKDCAKNSYFDTNNYKNFGWSKNELCDEVVSDAVNDKIIKFLSDYLMLNIFILDVEQDELFFGSGAFVQYKKNVFLLRFENDLFEPFFIEQSRTYSHSDEIMKIVLKNSEKIRMIQFDKKNILEFNNQSFAEDLEKYLPKNKKTKNTEPNDSTKPIEPVEPTKSTEPVELESEELNAFDDEQSDTQEVSRSANKHLTEVSDSSDSDSESTSQSESGSESESESESEKASIKLTDVSQNMKLGELQKIASQLKISLKENNNARTKAQLYKKITEKLTK